MKNTQTKYKINNTLTYLYILIFTSSISFNVKAANEISVTATAGNTGPVLYSSLSGAGGVFAAINAGTHKGVITVSATASESAETGINALNASGSGLASYTSITIQPQGGSAIIVSGNVAGPMITLNAAGNVTIDGLNTGGNALTILNSDSGAASSTIHFVGVTNSTGASNDTIQNCTIAGAGSGMTKGTIFFDAGLNANNTISNCVITSVGTTYSLATNAIYEAGSSAADNSSNSITNCSIADYFNAAATSFGVLINNDCANGGWIITGNTFFQSNTRTSAGGSSVVYGAISISGGGNGWNVSGNTIGYATANHTGAMTYTCAPGTAALYVFRGIQILGVGSSSVSGFNNDTIANISFTTNSVVTTVPGIFNAIYSSAATGLINIGSSSSTGNIISNISVISNNSGTGKTGVLASCIYINSTAASAINIKGNSLAAVNCQSTDTTSGFNFAGIFTNGTAGFVVSNNTVGDTSANSIYIGTVATTTSLQTLFGIQMTGSGSVTAQNNVVRNLTSFCNSGLGKANTAANVMNGILISPGVGIDVSGNNVSYLTVVDTTGYGTTNGAGSITINGISVGSSGNTVSIQNNTITNMNAYGQKTGGGNGNGAASTLNGILVTAGSVVTVSNNPLITSFTGNSTSSGSIYTVGTVTIDGIAVQAASTSAAVSNNDSISNLTAISIGHNNGRAGNATVDGISVAAAGSPVTVTGNPSISNLTANGYSTSNGGSATSTVNGIFVSAGAAVNINNNASIYSLTANSYEFSNGGGGTSFANGILVSGGATVTIDSNAYIYLVTANSYETSNGGAGPSTANGISVTGATGAIKINSNGSIDSVTANSYQSGSFSNASNSTARGISVSGAVSGNITIDGNSSISSILADSHLNNNFSTAGISNAYGISVATGAGVNITNNPIISSVTAKSYSLGSSNTNVGGPASCYGINVTAATGVINIISNQFTGIFSSDAHGGKTAGSAKTYGISVSGTGAASSSNIYNNSVSGLTATSTAATTVGNDTIYGISVSSGITTNIGGSTAPGGNTISNLTATGPSSGTVVRGISVTAGTPSIVGNIISSLSSNATNAGTGAGDAMIGILTNVATIGQMIDSNAVHGLTITGTPSTAVNIDGILVTDTGSEGNVTRSDIYSLANSSTSANSSVSGIHVNNSAPGGWNVVNNMIALNNTDAASSVNGVILDGGICNFYFNSIYMSGAATAQASYALLRADSVSAVKIVDNILINDRGTGSTQNNYAVGYASATGWTATNSNFNDLVSSGLNVGNAAGSPVSFANWLVTGADLNSLNLDVSASFTNPAVGDLHLPPSVILNGISLAPSWIIDIDGDPRPAIPRMGADETASTVIRPTSSFVSSDTALCVGNCISFTNNSVNATSYQWLFPGATPSSSTAATPSSICYTSPGNYDVTLIASNAIGTDTLVISNYINVGLVNATARPDTSVCSGYNVQLNASGGGSYEWSPTTGLSDSTINNPKATPLSTTTYTVTVTSGNCTATATVTVNVYPVPPTPSVSQSHDTLFCSNDTSYISYQWYKDSTIINGESRSFLVIHSNGNYNVFVQNKYGCGVAAGINADTIAGIPSFIGNNQLLIYPNPATEKLQVKGYALGEESVLVIYDVLGKAVLSQNLSLIKTQEETLDISALAKGIYIVEVSSAKASKLFRTKILIE